MNRITSVPFGPQHPVLPEPLHIALAVEDETVTEATPQLGFVHRGLEGLVRVRDYKGLVHVVERICGICSCIHAGCYCNAVEDMLGISAPPRAQFLRVVWSELHRIHSHLLWLGLFADAFGFESAFHEFWRLREHVLDVCEATTGNRIILSVNVVGGVRRDINQERIRWIRAQMDELETGLLGMEKVMLEDYTVQERTRGVGVLEKEEARRSGAVGPVLRASGWEIDERMNGYAAYGELDFEPVTATEGDCNARCKVRFEETLRSIDLVREALGRLPDSELAVPATGLPDGESVFRAEQPRGELFYYLRGNGTKMLERLRVRTPTFANIPALLGMLPGIRLADVPVVVLSIDPCISCTER
ncbi:MAG: nickel-dependent hydrogenase large subunit [Desulfovibrio sp.]|jgi:ech hydrogenase subunit E|nr:nickel-dependent hydrogenase large subunit [Desulfovibrio sp.]